MDMELSSGVLDSLTGKTVAVAVSGGVDSMTLLHLFWRRGDIKYFAVNVEHGIRGESSLRDSAFVKDFCREKNIPLMEFSVDCIAVKEEKGLTLEEAAREERRRIFRELIESGKCDTVALAHHASDQAETALMRIIRGTGTAGLRAMEEASYGFVRPLLGFSRSDIESYARAQGVPFVTDESNLCPAYSRNFLRNDIIPRIKARFPAFEGSLLRLVRSSVETEDFISGFVRPPEWDDCTVVIRQPFPHPAVFKREAAEAFRMLNVFKDIEERHLTLLTALQNAKNGTRLDMPGCVYAYRENGGISFVKEDEKARSVCCLIPPDFEGTSLGVTFTKCGGKEKEAGALKFDGDKIPTGAVLRYRKDGDVFTKFGGGTKSLGDFLTDKKIPLRLRDTLPLLAMGNEIFFIAGVEISDKIKLDEKTLKIVKISF